jgi:dTDP-glucose 4,6-dehydratase/UDP-glucose 4-epimerase
MKILIIGSKGFIGSHALHYFRHKNDEAYGCDVVVDYEDEKYFLIDATQPSFQEPFKAIDFDVCINCSGAASVPFSIQNPLHDFQLNTTNVFLVLNSIKEYQPLCKFINLSSAAVYGNPVSLPIQESHSITPVSPYGEHKRMSEEICQEFHKYFSIPTCNLRIFSAYGEGLRKQLLWDLYKKSLQNKVELFGTGHETRDFIFISDLLIAIDLIIQKADFNGESINIANGIQSKIKDITSMFFEALHYKGEVRFIGTNREGDPLHWEADITKLKSFGYASTTNLQQGIEKYIEWLKSI